MTPFAFIGRILCSLGLWIMGRPRTRHVLSAWGWNNRLYAVRCPAWEADPMPAACDARARLAQNRPLRLPPGWRVAEMPDAGRVMRSGRVAAITTEG